MTIIFYAQGSFLKASLSHPLLFIIIEIRQESRIALYFFFHQTLSKLHGSLVIVNLFILQKCHSTNNVGESCFVYKGKLSLYLSYPMPFCS